MSESWEGHAPASVDLTEPEQDAWVRREAQRILERFPIEVDDGCPEKSGQIAQEIVDARGLSDRVRASDSAADFHGASDGVDEDVDRA